MTTSLLTPKVSAPIPSADRKKRVLLIDASSRKRELRAEIMRRLGVEVDSAADIGEARCWWKVDLYDLVLINIENHRGSRDKFCDDIRAAAPRQRFAFLVGKPEYLSGSPGPDLPSHEDFQDAPRADVRAALSADREGVRRQGPPRPPRSQLSKENSPVWSSGVRQVPRCGAARLDHGAAVDEG